MKNVIPALLTAGFIFASAQASADDMQKDQMVAHKQMMKECMSRMQAKNDGSTHDQMKSACTTEMKNNADAMGDHAMKPSDKAPGTDADNNKT